MAAKTTQKERIMGIVIVLLCIVTALLDFIDITYATDKTCNRLLQSLMPPLVGSIAVILLVIRSGSKIFGKPQCLWAMIPCLIIAIDNFPFASYFGEQLKPLVNTEPIHFVLFALNCIFVGLFEEIIFRGIFFALLAGTFTNDRKGFLKTYVISSLIFGGVHLFNVFFGAGIGPTLLQAGYTVLTGGLFAFAFIKTKNILFAAFTHAVYNFAGLLFTAEQGLGAGSAIFYLPNVIVMAAVSILVGTFVLYKVWTYPEEERVELYGRLGFGVKGKPKGVKMGENEANQAP